MLQLLLFQFFLVASIHSDTHTHTFSYEVLPESKISISGTSNVSSFKCFAADCAQKGSFVVFEKNDSNIISFYNALFSVKVRSLDCNNSLINRDLYKTLNSDKYPFIVLQIKEAELISFFPNSVFKYKVKVDMILANNQRETKGEVLVQKINSDVFRVSGVQKIKLTDFNIKPPTAMLGLIVVDDEMTITFNLVLKARKDLIGN